MSPRPALAALLVVLALLSTACEGNAVQEDAATDAEIVEADSLTVMLMPEGFRNVAIACLDGNGVYVTSRGGVTVTSSGELSTTSSGGSLPSGIEVIPEDPRCAR